MELSTSGNEDAAVWGPKFWRNLHTYAENVGVLLDESKDEIVASKMNTIINDLPLVIPCSVCQLHAAEYIKAHPINLIGLKRTALRDAARLYLYTFHNSVRTSKGQPIIVNLEDLETLYGAPLTRSQIIDLPILISKAGIDWGNSYYLLSKMFGYY